MNKEFPSTASQGKSAFHLGTCDQAAFNARQAEIEKIMRGVTQKRYKLTERIVRNDVDTDDARQRNKKMPGLLGELWAVFIELPAEQQVKELDCPQFKGMAWQSLLQCNPYL